MYKIKFSIIIPTFNREFILGETLRSVQNQSYDNWEAIIVDDGSTDQTKALVESFDEPRFKYFYKKNEERSIARNFGIEQSDGDFITFLDSDDILLENCLQNALDYLKTNSQAEVFHLAYEIRDRKNKNVLSKYPKDRFIMNESLLSGNPMSCMTTFLRRYIGNNYKFDTDKRLLFSEDWEYWLRISTEYDIYFCNKLSGVLYEHENRGVNLISVDKHIESKSFFLNKVLQNSLIFNKYNKKLKRLMVHSKLYIALEYALLKNKKICLSYLFSAISISPFLALRQRIFWGTIKNLFISKQ